MKLLIDENIPFADAFFSELGAIERFAGRELKPEQLKDADALLVRSITKVNEALLAHANRLKFVGTATIGVDHIDKPLLKARNIDFSSAPGCNAISVAEYVISALLVLSERYQFDFRDKTVGIVGVGNIGRALKAKLEALGVRLLLVDPFRAREEAHGEAFHSLERVLQDADIITLHTPLTVEGPDTTFHLLNETNLELLKDDVCLINACRGEVIDNQALLRHVQARRAANRTSIKLVLDVWENEPEPLQALLPFTDIATAHIAGYSLEGKSRGTEILYQKLCQVFGQDATLELASLLPTAEVTKLNLTGETFELSVLKQITHLVYDARRDDALFRYHLNGQGFDWLRKNYPIRREWSSLQLDLEKKSSKSIDFSQLGFAI
mgnify:CR=1 FL=1